MNKNRLTILFVGILLLGASAYIGNSMLPERRTQSQQTTAAETEPVTGSAFTETADTRTLETSPNQEAAQGSDIDPDKLAELLDRHLSPAMRSEINELLRPGGKPPEIVEYQGRPLLDTSDRASTVMIGFIDSEAGLVITDITQPLPEPAH